MALAAVVLAAGKGTRMKSRRPKVLHRVAGKPMVAHVIKAARKVGVDRLIVVAGYGFEDVAAAVEPEAEVVCQAEQLGTAHAVMQAEKRLTGFEGDILVLCGDTPLLTGQTLSGLVAHHRNTGAAATVLTARLDDPFGYGRVLRDAAGMVRRIVEQKDGSPDELTVQEINTGVYCFRHAGFFETLHRITPQNKQGEFYLTDIIEMYVTGERPVVSYLLDDFRETLGVNDRRQLAEADRLMRERVLNALMAAGVTVVDPASTFVEDGVTVGMDTVIHPFSFLEGSTTVGEDCTIGPATRLINAQIGDGSTVQQSVIVDSRVGLQANIGPYAYIRPGSEVGDGVKIGDFVEIKKSRIGTGSKVPHLSYIGDAVIGSGVNVGAGTITCNYDGVKKWTTIIEDGAFIGSNTNLVAPVRVGEGAYVGAGSTITKDVPPGALGVARGPQTNIKDWVQKKKGRTEDKANV
ncbi:MAG: bifunctional UDP-N-acetylglucosamine diphosphorylase/glucosamine-1-phosphate N-acetyltransferase GlmU [Desulforudis sp.]|jgi:bifunctional UDP-N-acetylglucosamine pyrophosphorylase/glucosamine-1-phosphate N-acetyltransferase|nr:bifunctional UDP-N-acetylglucosamine diphosphorylase/glucosamine-1-phosphate N-acetyltransferase GlmU [Clostridia bacterium]MDQ7791860.1 bifunctional UDP-N-acetylglucosamine diphosphorylase/glucosamine-1-phosphate N-acetyltransferase GlmU [Clostridia bacterium]RJX22097.1 MAG: bifunctional UDP-N-acetylglucosamine diphosphorylase/glucosamine-1-phosphate N-acetyltransferase GlmU [Desulforudis sp.]